MLVETEHFNSQSGVDVTQLPEYTADPFLRSTCSGPSLVIEMSLNVNWLKHNEYINTLFSNG